jgi:hypothetical protein
LKNIQRKIGNKYNIIEKKRVLLKEGFLFTVNNYYDLTIAVYVILFNDLLIICDFEGSNKPLKPKLPLDLIGMLVKENVNAFDVKQVRIKLPSPTKSNKQMQLNVENGFAINIPCIQKVFKFYTRHI